MKIAFIILVVSAGAQAVPPSRQIKAAETFIFTDQAVSNFLDLYHPDYIFIFNWDDNKEQDVFNGLTPKWNEKEFVNGLISTYHFNEYKTKLVWCPHPNNLRWKSMSIDRFIPEIAKVT